MTKKMIKLINKLEQELIYINGAFNHIKSHIINQKNKPILSANILKADLKNGIKLINEIVKQKQKEV
jgi:hypothetical protein